MQNVDTLSKSHKDAEEERKQRLADDQIQHDSQQWSRNGWHDEENESINYMEVHEPDISLDAVSVEKYLTYNNPMINSFSIHSFITSALSAAHTYGLLPDYMISKGIFNVSLASSAEMAQHRMFHVPVAISEEMESNWRERIQYDVIKSREQQLSMTVQPLSTSMTTTQVTSNISFNDIMTNNIGIMPISMDTTFANVAREFGLNEDQKRTYYFFLNALKSIVVGQNSSRSEIKDHCIYLGGSGGTGKSQVIKAIIEGFR